MRFRKLRIAWSVGWGVIAVLLCVLWVRSNGVNDQVRANWSKTAVMIRSEMGAIKVSTTDYLQRSGPWWDYRIEPPINDRRHTLEWGYFTTRHARLMHIYVGHWIVLLMVSITAGLPWLRWRFSLRTLLIATTLVAFGLGSIIALSR
jgi:hypothetical protein